MIDERWGDMGLVCDVFLLFSRDKRHRALARWKWKKNPCSLGCQDLPPCWLAVDAQRQGAAANGVL